MICAAADPYTTNAPTTETTAAANKANAAVEAVGTVAGAAFPIDVVAYTRLKARLELLTSSGSVSVTSTH
jgi:hypothetical protein